VNIGEGGMGLHTSHPFKAKEQALVQFTLPDQPSQFSAELDVCWCDQNGRLGVRFLALSAQQKSGFGSGSRLGLKKAFRNAWQSTFGKALPSAKCYPRFLNSGASNPSLTE